MPEWTQGFSVGVPAPAGAVLGLLPLMASFALEMHFQDLPLLFAFSLLGSGLLMISRTPTYVLKNVRVPHPFVRLLLMMVAVFMAALFSVPWWTLSLGAMIYLLSIPLSLTSYRRLKRLTAE
jgi:CDP-diacylglycerol--serine O-phosphatidyltransferase